MNCTQARPLFSSYLDGAVSGVEMHEVSRHLDQCSTCKTEYGQLENTRILLSSLGHRQAPPDLAVRIRITLASARTRTWREVMRGRMVRLQNALDAFMLPATAGVVAAVFFCVGLMGFFVPPVSANPGDDVPTLFYTPPRLESSAYPDSNLDLDSSILIETDIDATGHVQDYRVISGRDDAQVREQLNRALLFIIFSPAQSFGRPVPGKAIISFAHIHVKG
ncbi:MAG TPA: zf-HC2 domain-containing protein [Candidatus Angelobacter sp.]|nr:zf-HC2 domain-containing protein [Candidatus Angelobacter sp.]